MAVPIFGGMAIGLLTMFVVPVLYCLVEECRRIRPGGDDHPEQPA